MKSFTGKELFDGFSGISRTLQTLKVLADKSYVEQLAKKCGIKSDVKKLQKFAMLLLDNARE